MTNGRSLFESDNKLLQHDASAEPSVERGLGASHVVVSVVIRSGQCYPIRSMLHQKRGLAMVKLPMPPQLRQSVGGAALGVGWATLGVG